MTHHENVFCADFKAKRQEMDVKREAWMVMFVVFFTEY